MKEIKNTNLLSGDKLFQKRARMTLPFLVRQAKAGKPISYLDLAAEIGIPNPRNLDKILEEILLALKKLSKKTGDSIPDIQDIVINKQTKVPGYYKTDRRFKKLSLLEKRYRLEVELSKVYAYPRWDRVLNQLGLEPLPINLEESVNKLRKFRGGGESEAHKQFKSFLADNPSLLQILAPITNCRIEFGLLSGDKLDILFSTKNSRIGVEVKSKISDEADILRGLFQCLKYRHILEGENKILNRSGQVRLILALEGKFPDHLIAVKNVLGIEVIDQIKTSR